MIAWTKEKMIFRSLHQGYSLGKVFSTIIKKGIVGALEDTEQGPHVHLTLLLITVVIVSVAIILVSEVI